MNAVSYGWYDSQIDHDDLNDMRKLTLMYLHALLEGLERRIVERGGGNPLETYGVLELRRFSQQGNCQRWMSNFEKLLQIVIEKERAEIDALNGRAA